jgi:hypothetical protein
MPMPLAATILAHELTRASGHQLGHRLGSQGAEQAPYLPLSGRHA